ncbi:MAG: PEP-CTERM system histidine kinase PrsK, partial [Gammaproteobacteria bacterium]|nr:PEP-CTERM system histidine kinase PrsK [Gammaproteobacteria bacterium]
MNLGLYSYIAAAVAYGFFFALLLFSWRSSLQGKLLASVIGISTVWAIFATAISTGHTELNTVYQVLEILRYLAWYIFLIKLFDTASTTNPGYRKFTHWAMLTCVGFSCLLLINELFSISESTMPGIIGHVFLPLAGLAIIEQLYRNTSIQHRWAIKYLLIGAGGIFAFDFYLYADAFLFRTINYELWESRGIIHFVFMPLLVIASVRNKNWSLNVFVSRDIVLNTTAIMGGGIYLLAMAAAGYYLREFGGSWSRLNQILFFSLAIALLASVLFSGRLRAHLRVFLGKHFYKNKYDYRREWLKLTDRLHDKFKSQDSFESDIRALALTVEARGGSLWLCDQHSVFNNVATWNIDRVHSIDSDLDSLIQFMKDKNYVINLTELESHADEYQNLKLPNWINKLHRPWLIVPLFGLDSLIGFIILTNPLVNRPINWEDRDLLKTAARQISSHITVLITSDALAEAKQFEVFSRLSAYMVHDLKNIATELEMVAHNASTHMNNPEFIADAFNTVDNAANDIKRLLTQLRNRQVQTENKSLINLNEFL